MPLLSPSHAIQFCHRWSNGRTREGYRHIRAAREGIILALSVMHEPNATLAASLSILSHTLKEANAYWSALTSSSTDLPTFTVTIHDRN